MPNNIYLYTDYKKYIESQIQASRRTKGYRLSLSTAAGCQPSFLSKVLNGPTHLTPEHGAGMARFWNLNSSESEYFLQLVAHSRAGTPILREMVQRRMQRIKREQDEIERDLKLPPITSGEAEAFYYSSWEVAAIHVLVSIPQFRTIERIAARLLLGSEAVKEILDRLLTFGLVEKKGDKWLAGPSQIHAPKGSGFSTLHMLHWRQRAVGKILNNGKSSYHYSSLHSLSEADAELILQEIVSLIRRTTDRVKDSKEEKLVCLNVDYFEP